MDTQAMVTLTVGLAAPAVAAFSAVLVQRYSRRDDRENLKRDLERLERLPANSTARPLLAVDIDRRERELIEREPLRRYSRSAAVWFAVMFTGLTAINTVTAGDRWVYYLIGIGMWALLVVTVVAMIAAMGSAMAAVTTMPTLTRTPGDLAFALLVYVPGTLVLFLGWMVLLPVNSVRRLSGRPLVGWMSFKQVVTVYWPYAGADSRGRRR